MTCRERFVAALRCQAVDCVPFFDQLYHRDLYEATLGERPDLYDNLFSAQLAAAIGLDASIVVYAQYPGIDRPDANGMWTSEWGVRYQVSPEAWPTGFGVEYGCSTLTSLRCFTPPQADAPLRWESASKAIAFLHDSEIAAVGALRGPFAMLAWHFLGMETALTSVYDDPSLLTLATQAYTTHAIQIVHQWALRGTDCLFITEDLGSTRGPLISPRMYEQFFAPYLKLILQAAREHELPVIIHSDGQVSSFVEMFIDAGASALHPLEKNAGMSLASAARQWGGRLARCGNLDTKGLLRSGTPAQVRDAVRDTITEGMSGSGYVFATDHSISDGIPLENIHAMIDEVHRFRSA